MKNKSILLVFLMLIICTVSFSQPGSLDSEFGTDGFVMTGFNNVSYAAGYSLAVQTDGKIVVAGLYQKSSGFHDFALVRYNMDGSLDGTFGIEGVVTTDLGSDDISYAVVLQADGKIVVAGTSSISGLNKFAIARYTTDGTLDSSFGTDGLVLGPLGEGRSVALQADGKILVAGSTLSLLDFSVVRYNPDGTLDNTFASGGIATTDFGGGTDQAKSIAIQLDGKIIVAGTSESGGSDFAIVRYNPNGTLDDTFNGNGILTTNMGTGEDGFGNSVLIQPDGKIVVAGTSSNDNGSSRIAVVRYTSVGNLDNSFGPNGIVKTFIGDGFASGKSVALQTDGKLVVAGYDDWDFALVRYNEDGSLDATFDSDGIVISDLFSDERGYSCVIQQDGKILVAGTVFNGQFDTYVFVVARYISGLNLGVISFSSQDHGLLIYPNPLKENAIIEYTLTNDETISIDLYDISGRIVQSFVQEEKRDKGPHKESLVIDTSISSGTYILRLSNGIGRTSIRVIK